MPKFKVEKVKVPLFLDWVAFFTRKVGGRNYEPLRYYTTTSAGPRLFFPFLIIFD